MWYNRGKEGKQEPKGAGGRPPYDEKRRSLF